MVRITGSLRFVTDNPAQVSEVWLRAPKVRTHLEGVVTTGNDRFPANNGEVSFTAVPGPAVLALISQGRAVDTIPILVGDAPASQTLAEVVKRARVAGGHTAEELQVLVRQIQEAVSGSGEQATAAAASAKAAAASAVGAKSSESSARSSASQAKTSASQASSSASAAKSSERSADKSAENAAASEKNAGASASNAAKSARAAKSDAERAATIAGSTRWVGTKVEVNGRLSPELMPKITVSSKGTWVVNGVDTGLRAQGPPGNDGSTRFEDLTPAQRESLVGKQGPAGVVASSTDPGKDVVWLDTAGQVGGLSEPYELVASGAGWQYATKPGGSSRYVVDYRGWAVLTVTATSCDEVRLYDFSQATNPFAFAVPPAGNIKGALLTTQAVINCASNGPAVRVLNPTDQTKVWLSVEPLEARGQVVWVPDGKGGRESFTALAGPAGPQGPPGPAGTTRWDGITGKPATYPTAWSEVLGKPATFPPEKHRHQWSEIDGKPERFPAESHTHTLADVTDAGSLADKEYVDQQVKEVADQVTRRPAFFWGFGPPPKEIPGAVVGDVYCNLSTGELHEITGV